MQGLTTTVARIIFAIPFGIFGLFHFMNAPDMATEFVPSFIPGGEFWVYLTGLGLVLACVSLLIQKQMRLACLLLAAMLGIFVLTIHLPGLMEGKEIAMPMLLKDLGLAGGALTYAGLSKD